MKLKCIFQTFLSAIFIFGIGCSDKVFASDLTCGELTTRYKLVGGKKSAYVGGLEGYKDFFTKKVLDKAIVNKLFKNFNIGELLFSKEEIKKIKLKKTTNLVSDLLAGDCTWYDAFFSLYSKKIINFTLWFDNNILSGDLNSELQNFINKISTADIEKLEKKLEKKWRVITLNEARLSSKFWKNSLKNIKQPSHFNMFKILGRRYNDLQAVLAKHPYKKYTQKVILEEAILAVKEKHMSVKSNNKLGNKYHAYLSAIVGSLDAHSYYIKLKKETKGVFINRMESVGLGIDITCFSEECLVTEIFKESASFKKLEEGDLIIAINSIEKKGMSTDAFIFANLQGKKDSVANLKILRIVDNKEQILNVSITRGLLKANRFESKILAHNTGYIKLASFYTAANGFSSSSEDFISALANMDSQANSLIIDLQNNGGGSEGEVVNILAALQLTSERSKSNVFTKNNCGEDKSNTVAQASSKVFLTGETFLKLPGERSLYVMPLLTYFSVKKISPRLVFYCNRKPYFAGKPIVVLINKKSASASEVLSLSLKEAGIALIVGDKQTYGKGSGQIIVNKNLKLTTMLWGSFLGTSIQFKGVQSDIVLNFSENKKSVKKIIREKDLFRALPAIGNIGSPWKDNAKKVNLYYKTIQKRMQKEIAIPLGKLSQSRQKEIQKKFNAKEIKKNLTKKEERKNIEKSVIQEAINILQDWKSINIEVYNSQKIEQTIIH